MSNLRTLRQRRAGFSLLELVITLSLIAILVGVVGFRSTSVLDKGKISSVLQLQRNLTTACAMYNSDTGLYAVEWPGAAANKRKLSVSQTEAGWAGPYLEKPLSDDGSNPWGQVRLYNTVNANGWISGFDLDGDGKLDVKGTGNMLWLSGLEQETAESIDRSIDSGVDGNWRSKGRFRFNKGKKHGYLLIYR